MLGRLVNFVEAAGDFALFGVKVTRELFRAPFEIGELTRQIVEVGTQSVPLILASGLALGVVVAMHSHTSMARFGADAMVPAAVSIGIFRILGPLVTGLLVSGRVGAGIGAELGGMRVTQQIDALEALGVDSFKYLVVTRVIACVLALPVLTVLMDFCGLSGGMFLETTMAHVTVSMYIRHAFQALSMADYVPTVLKTAVFGLIIGTVSCHLGFNTAQGATGVGRAATKSVVLCSLLLILVDIVLVKLTIFWTSQ